VYWPFESIDPIKWEAFATFVTGALAVGAALIVGLRQLAIVSAQHELHKSQSERDLALCEQELRIIVLDKRIDIVESIRPIWTRWWRDGRISYDDSASLLNFAQQAKYVFSDAVYEDLINFAVRVDWIRINYERSKESAAHGDENERKRWLEEVYKLEDELRPKFENIVSRLTDETRLSSMVRFADGARLV
jgi:hypothetical protein